MSTIDDAIATMKKNLAEKTGKSFAAWVNIARSLGTDKHSDISPTSKKRHRWVMATRTPSRWKRASPM